MPLALRKPPACPAPCWSTTTGLWQQRLTIFTPSEHCSTLAVSLRCTLARALRSLGCPRSCYAAPLVFVSSHVAEARCPWPGHHCKPCCRAVVTGALTAEAHRPLPADMEAFVQSAGEAGFVFASLGVSALAGKQWPRLRPCVPEVSQILGSSCLSSMDMAEGWRTAPHSNRSMMRAA